MRSKSTAIILIALAGILGLVGGVGLRYFTEKPSSESIANTTQKPSVPITDECALLENVDDKRNCYQFAAVDKNIDALVACGKTKNEEERTKCLEKLKPPQYLGLSPEEIIEHKNQEIRRALLYVYGTKDFGEVFNTLTFDNLPPSGTTLTATNQISASETLNLVASIVIKNGGEFVKLLRSTGKQWKDIDQVYFVLWAKLNGSPNKYFCVDYGQNSGIELSAEPAANSTSCTGS